MSGRYRRKRELVEELLKKHGLNELPKDTDGRWVTARLSSRKLNTDKKPVRINTVGNRIVYTCPKCGKPPEYRKKAHKNLCMRCGQALDWSACERMPGVWILARDSGEAGYWAEQYMLCSGRMDAFDTEQWQRERKTYPLPLYFLFPNEKGYGAFMRKAAKEALLIREFRDGEPYIGKEKQQK